MDSLAEASEENDERQRWLDQIEQARRRIDAIEAHAPNRAELQSKLAIEYHNVGNIDLAIHYARLSVTPTTDKTPAARLSNFCAMLSNRYDIFGRPEDATEAVAVGRIAVANARASKDLEDCPRCLNALASALRSQGGRELNVDSITEGIDLVREAMGNHVPEEAELEHVSTMALLLESKNEIEPSVDTLEKAIRWQEIAARRTLNATFLVNLSKLSFNFFERKGDLQSLNLAIAYATVALKLGRSQGLDLGLLCHNLCDYHCSRYTVTGNPGDVAEAIQYGEMGVDPNLTPLDHRSRPTRLDSLGGALLDRFESATRTGDVAKALEDLQSSIKFSREAAEISNNNTEADRAYLLNNLSMRLCSLFQRTGDPKVIQDAINAEQEALRTEPSRGLRERYSRNLSRIHGLRFETLGDSDDLNEAIRLGNEVLELISPDDKSGMADCIENLASLLCAKFERTDEESDIDAAIAKQDQVLNSTSENSPKLKVERLHNLASFMGTRFKKTSAPGDIDLAIQREEEASRIHNELLGPGAIYTAILDYNLSLFYGMRSKENDIDLAIGKAARALKNTPSDHPVRVQRLDLLGRLLARRNASQDAEDAKSNFSEAAKQVNGHPLLRYRAATAAGILYCQDEEWRCGLEVLQIAIDLLPRISPRSLLREDQQYLISTVPNVSALAASIALAGGHRSSKARSKALRLQEAGRGIINGLAISWKTDILSLRDKSESLYYQYEKLRQDFSPSQTQESRNRIFATSQPTDDVPRGLRPLDSLAGGDAVSVRNDLLAQIEKIEDQIRREVPGFELFQLRPSSKFLKSLAKDYPIISFNVTTLRSDAFIVTNKDISAISLPKLCYADLDEKARWLLTQSQSTVGYLQGRQERNETLRGILTWVWDVAVNPVLKKLRKLKVLNLTKDGALPRVCWITSGLMGLMPLHAAGSNWMGSSENTASHVVSSYAPTFKALAFARERSSRQESSSSRTLSIIAMPQTVGKGDLNAQEDIEGIRESLQESCVSMLDPLTNPSKTEVVKAMNRCDIVHFVCHGKSDAVDPSKGCLFFHPDANGQAERLTVQELSLKRLDNVQLAYLSACSTAEIASEKLLEEAIHIGSTFQLIGYPNVVATLWEADNDAARETSRLFYKKLASSGQGKEGLDFSEAVARALHFAIAEVRAGKVKSDWRKVNAPDDVTAWAPFVHIGC